MKPLVRWIICKTRPLELLQLVSKKQSDHQTLTTIVTVMVFVVNSMTIAFQMKSRSVQNKTK